jgi:hypothetical protein
MFGCALPVGNHIPVLHYRHYDDARHLDANAALQSEESADSRTTAQERSCVRLVPLADPGAYRDADLIALDGRPADWVAGPAVPATGTEVGEAALANSHPWRCRGMAASNGGILLPLPIVPTWGVSSADRANAAITAVSSALSRSASLPYSRLTRS